MTIDFGIRKLLHISFLPCVNLCQNVLSNAFVVAVHQICQKTIYKQTIHKLIQKYFYNFLRQNGCVVVKILRKKRFVFLPENPKTFFETAASLQRKSHEHSSLLLMHIGRPNRKGNAVSRNSTRINTKYCQFTLPSDLVVNYRFFPKGA